MRYLAQGQYIRISYLCDAIHSILFKFGTIYMIVRAEIIKHKKQYDGILRAIREDYLRGVKYVCVCNQTDYWQFPFFFDKKLLFSIPTDSLVRSKCSKLLRLSLFTFWTIETALCSALMLTFPQKNNIIQPTTRQTSPLLNGSRALNYSFDQISARRENIKQLVAVPASRHFRL